MAISDTGLELVTALEDYSLARNRLARHRSEARDLVDRDGAPFLRVRNRWEEVHPTHLEKLSANALASQCAELQGFLGEVARVCHSVGGTRQTPVCAALLRHATRILDATPADRFSEEEWLSAHEQRFPATAWRGELASEQAAMPKRRVFRRTDTQRTSMAITWEETDAELLVRRGAETKSLALAQEKAMFRSVAAEPSATWDQLLQKLASGQDGVVLDMHAAQSCHQRIHTRLEQWGLYWQVPALGLPPFWDPPGVT